MSARAKKATPEERIYDWFWAYAKKKGIRPIDPPSARGKPILFSTANLENAFGLVDPSESPRKIKNVALYGLDTGKSGATCGMYLCLTATDKTDKKERKRRIDTFKKLTGITKSFDGKNGAVKPNLYSSIGEAKASAIAPDAYTKEDIAEETVKAMIDKLLEIDEGWFGASGGGGQETTPEADTADDDDDGMEDIITASTRIESKKGFFIGDISYVLDEDTYHGVWGANKYSDGTYYVGKYGFTVHSTADGDGLYYGSDGETYPVDAGVIGVVPLELVAKEKEGDMHWNGSVAEGVRASLQYHEGEFRIKIWQADGELYKIYIRTGDSDDDYDDDDDDDAADTNDDDPEDDSKDVFDTSGIPDDILEQLITNVDIANQGDTEMQYALGLWFAAGKHVPQNYKSAVYWLRKAAKQGKAEAEYSLGLRYALGEGVEINSSAAAHWWTKAAAKGLAIAQAQMGECFLDGLGVPQDKEKALKLLKASAKQNCEMAIELLEKIGESAKEKHYYGEHAMTNFEKWKADMTVEMATEINENMDYWDDDDFERLPTNEKDLEAWKKARNVDEVAQLFSLSDCFGCPLDGGCESDNCTYTILDWADEPYDESAEKKAEESEESDDIDTDDDEYDAFAADENGDIDWLEKASEQGDGIAQHFLGLSYLEGTGVPKNREKAIFWLTKAANQGLSGSQSKLAELEAEESGGDEYDDDDDDSYDGGFGFDIGFGFEDGDGDPLQAVVQGSNEITVTVDANGGGSAELPATFLDGASHESIEALYEEAMKHLVKLSGKYQRAAKKEGKKYSGSVLRGVTLALPFKWTMDLGAYDPYDIEFTKDDYTPDELTTISSFVNNRLQQMQAGYGKIASDVPRQVAEMLPQAEAGDTGAMNDIAVLYYTGQCGEQDYEKAFYWFKKAAENGHANSQYNLGFWYHRGEYEGVDVNLKKAVYWYTKAAENGQPSAQFNLGQMYRNGEYVKYDIDMTMKLFEKAADQGHERAQQELALLKMTNGTGIIVMDAEGNMSSPTRDEVNAATSSDDDDEDDDEYDGFAAYNNGDIDWLEKAATQGDGIAQHFLGLSYLEGTGVPKNREKAIFWLTKAANQGLSGSQSELAKLQAEKSDVSEYELFIKNQGNIYPLIRPMKSELSKPFAGDLYILYYVDDGLQSLLLGRSHVPPAITVDQVHKIALGNLANATEKYTILYSDFDGGGIQPLLSSNAEWQHYSCSMILDPSAIAILSGALNSDKLIFSIVESAYLFVAPDTPQGVAGLKKATKARMSQASKPISDKLYVYDTKTGKYSVYDEKAGAAEKKISPPGANVDRTHYYIKIIKNENWESDFMDTPAELAKPVLFAIGSLVFQCMEGEQGKLNPNDSLGDVTVNFAIDFNLQTNEVSVNVEELVDDLENGKYGKEQCMAICIAIKEMTESYGE